MPEDLFIVGLGASAGGLEALERFFRHVPQQTKLAFLIVQHLSPDYKSHMVELLSKYTPLAVQEAADGVTVAPGTIHLLPPRKNMTIFKRKLYLVEYQRGNGLNLPIDIMLESLAKDQAANAIACILSGTGSDGTRGIRAIKEQGGFVLAQDDTAKFDGMPRSAIMTQLVDYVANPEAMPEIVLRYVNYPNSLNNDGSQAKPNADEPDLGKVLALLHDSVGVDFTGYKPNTLKRRIERRMSLFDLPSLAQYITLLQRSDTERQTLFKEFLIGVTSFFRDTAAFEYLQTDVIPTIMSQRDRRQQVRVWVAGCSTGEEAYSLAILFQDYMERTGHFYDIKIFATDIDQRALEQAGRGIFPESVLADIPQEFLQSYFIKRDEQYEAVREIRGMVVFANHNLITNPPFSRIDLVSCRNLLIYMQPEIQTRVLANFQFSLKPGGFLFLGSSENLGERSNAFVEENTKWKIFRFHGDHKPLVQQPHHTPNSHNHDNDAGKTHAQSSFRNGRHTPRPAMDWRASDAVLRSLVEQALPPCLVVDEQHMLVHSFGDISPYMQAPSGYQISLNVLNMVHEGLALPLSAALHRTLREDEAVDRKSVV